MQVNILICILKVIHCLQLQNILRKDRKLKLELLTDIEMLLMVEKAIRGGMGHSINRYIKSNEK